MSNETPSSSALGAALTNATITVSPRQLNIQPFIVSEDTNDTAIRWDKWKKNIERQFRFFGIIDSETKKDGLLIYGGQQIADLEDTLPEIENPDGVDDYTQLIKKLDKHFLPRKNKDYARFQFGNLTQDAHESMAKYYTRLRDIAKKCEFGDENDAIRDHIIKTMTNNRLRTKAIRHNWTLTQILDETAIEEETTAQTQEIDKHLQATTDNNKIKFVKPKLELCNRCGAKHERKKCKAYGVECFKCKKRNHYARMCLSTQNSRIKDDKSRKHEDNKKERKPTHQFSSRGRSRAIGRQIRHVEHENSNTESSESDNETDEDITRIIDHLNIHRTTQGQLTTNNCKIWINGHKTSVELDTGADANIMDEVQFNGLLRATPDLELRKTKTKLKTLKEDLPVVGECNVTIENKTRTTDTKLVIIKGKMDSPPLIGRKTLEELGMVKFDPTGGLKQPNRESGKNIHKIHTGNQEIDKIVQQHHKLFTGIGKAQRDGKTIYIHLPLKSNTTPITQKPRRVAYHLLDPLKNRINEFVENDIMEEVPVQEAITWCSPLVVQPKPKNPNDIRVSLDLRVLNRSMERTRHVQAPITEDFITTFKDCTVFSKLDMNHGYHQFSLDEESRKLMTFSSPWGNYRYKRLAFGGINSQDLFDAEMSCILSGLPRVLNNRDDILVGGIDKQDHDKNLEKLLQRLEAHNLTLRREKCEFGKSTIEFHGHLFTSEGLKPSQNKVKAVNECDPPKSREELISFLQMMAYLSRFISNFSSKCEPLRKLTKKDQKFQWKEEQQRAFEDLKTAITTAPVLIPYKPERETLVISDGSPTGLGGGIFQKTEHGFQPVHFVSRTLTETEKRYSQIEREALAVEFTTTRLSMYLLGAPHFQLATDHKPLIPLLNNPTAKLPPRIERMVMKIQNLDYTAIHIAGKSNMTDYLSRHPLPKTEETTHEKYIKATLKADHAIVMETFQAATKKDPELCRLQLALQTGNWDQHDPVLKPYYDLRGELYMAEDLVLRLDKIIPPESLRDKIITTAHTQGHLGKSKTKEMIRRKYWFPGMNQRIDNIISTCFSCQVVIDSHHTEPAKMTELPEGPWHTVEIDFFGPYPNHEYALVITDQYSRYPEVEFVTSTSIRPVRKKLKKVFSIYGVPKVVQSDNGPPFNSNEFKDFAKEMGFHHKRITPRHPKAQGQVEGFNKLMNKTLMIANTEGLDIHEATYDMLQAYRDTPHPATKETPYRLITNREIRTKLEQFTVETPPNDTETRKADARYKSRIKEYHDKRHKAKEQTITKGMAVIIRREKKKKAQTPYEPHIYLVTHVKGSTIYARRLHDGKTICRDSSKVKPLRKKVETNDEEKSKGHREQPKVPPAAKTPSTSIGTAAQQRPVTAMNQRTEPRRSQRKHVSVFERSLRDFSRS